MATVAEETEAQAEAAVIVVPIATVNENVLAAIAQMIENPLPAVKRVAIRVGEEAGAVMMIADTHAVIEVMVTITAVVGVGETVPVLAPLAETVVMITAIAMTVAILELETTTALEAAAPLGVMPHPSLRRMSEIVVPYLCSS